MDTGENTLKVFVVMDATDGKDLPACIFERGSAVIEFFIVQNQKSVMELSGVFDFKTAELAVE